jgi:hypothetical protein
LIKRVIKRLALCKLNSITTDRVYRTNSSYYYSSSLYPALTRITLPHVVVQHSLHTAYHHCARSSSDCSQSSPLLGTVHLTQYTLLTCTAHGMLPYCARSFPELIQCLLTLCTPLTCTVHGAYLHCARSSPALRTVLPNNCTLLDCSVHGAYPHCARSSPSQCMVLLNNLPVVVMPSNHPLTPACGGYGFN